MPRQNVLMDHLLAGSMGFWERTNYSVIDGVSILWYSQLENDL